MAPFHFRLQPALECARNNETLARRVVVDARLAFDDACKLLAAVESRIAELRTPVGATAAGRAGNFAAVEAAVIALGALLRRRRSEAHRARALLERARGVYARASAQRGALERLRERRLLEFDARAEAAETAEADEANGLRANTARSSAFDKYARFGALEDARTSAFNEEVRPRAFADGERSRAFAEGLRSSALEDASAKQPASTNPSEREGPCDEAERTTLRKFIP